MKRAIPSRQPRSPLMSAAVECSGPPANPSVVVCAYASTTLRALVTCVDDYKHRLQQPGYFLKGDRPSHQKSALCGPKGAVRRAE